MERRPPDPRISSVWNMWQSQTCCVILVSSQVLTCRKIAIFHFRVVLWFQYRLGWFPIRSYSSCELTSLEWLELSSTFVKFVSIVCRTFVRIIHQDNQKCAPKLPFLSTYGSYSFLLSWIVAVYRSKQESKSRNLNNFEQKFPLRMTGTSANFRQIRQHYSPGHLLWFEEGFHVLIEAFTVLLL